MLLFIFKYQLKSKLKFQFILVFALNEQLYDFQLSFINQIIKMILKF